jgi:hypothetical protein
MDEETRRFLDELLKRHVIVTQELITQMQLGFGEITARMRADSAQLQAEIADQREQIQANTAAILKLLDRFGDGPAPA